ELEQGKLDLCILRAPLNSTLIDTRLWFRDGYSLVYNNNLYKIEKDEDIEKLKEATFVFYNKNFAPDYHKSLMQICALYGFTPNVVHESNNINSIIQLVRNGLGVSIVPSSLVKNHSYEELEFMEIKRTQLFTEVLLATPKDHKTEIADEAIEFLQTTLEVNSFKS
ncbi:MAG: LysR family transcriptional regulator substrate-binding protein, partial [Bacteroidota bacterium]